MEWDNTKYDKEKLTALEVRDALIECFTTAHCSEVVRAITGKDCTSKEANDFILEMIKKAFTQIDGDFDNPTKDSILKVMDILKNMAKNFRNPQIISKNYNAMLDLVEKIEE